MNDCTECKRFLFCDKNLEEWDKIKQHYHIDIRHMTNMTTPLTSNERKAIAYMNTLASKCTEGVNG